MQLEAGFRLLIDVGLALAIVAILLIVSSLSLRQFKGHKPFRCLIQNSTIQVQLDRGEASCYQPQPILSWMIMSLPICILYVPSYVQLLKYGISGNPQGLHLIAFQIYL